MIRPLEAGSRGMRRVPRSTGAGLGGPWGRRTPCGRNGTAHFLDEPLRGLSGCYYRRVISSPMESGFGQDTTGNENLFQGPSSPFKE
jgi:hypothetical protein